MKIRQANKNDLKEIVKIEKICFPKAEAASEKDIYERFEVFGENFLVAEKDNKIRRITLRLKGRYLDHRLPRQQYS